MSYKPELIQPMSLEEVAAIKQQIETRWRSKPHYDFDPGRASDPYGSPGVTMRAHEVLRIIAALEHAVNGGMRSESQPDDHQGLIKSIIFCTEMPEGDALHVTREAASMAICYLEQSRKRKEPLPRILPEDGDISFTWEFGDVKLYRTFDGTETTDSFRFIAHRQGERE